MFNPTSLIIDSLTQHLKDGYGLTYGGYKPHYADIIAWASNMALENIANSDALYHNIEHTIFVTSVGQEILRGKHIKEGGIACEDWLHFHIALLCHDIGYVKGVCRQDQPDKGLYATGAGGKLIALPCGATDASLTPFHVDRSKLFVAERFDGHKLIDAEEIQRYIEMTRFPAPADAGHSDTVNLPGLARSADLIGQLCDPRYLQKIPALFHELAEIGANKNFGYRHPGDLRAKYPDFYWNIVLPHIKPALNYLQVTQAGKEILAGLYANVFRVESEQLPFLAIA